MSVEEFTIQPSSSLGLIPLVILVVVGVVILLLAVVTGRNAKTVRRTFVVLVIVGI